MAEQEELTKNIGETKARLERAAKLTTGLADEQIRWADSVKVSVPVLALYKYSSINQLVSQLVRCRLSWLIMPYYLHKGP